MADQTFECGICLERYDLDARRPKVIPCGHTYCLSCLSRNQMSRGSSQCPKCRRVFTGDAKALSDNYVLFHSLEEKENCASMSFFCVQCQCQATDKCLQQHNIRNMTTVVQEKVQEAKNSVRMQFKKEENLLKEFSKMLQSTKDAVENTLLSRIQKEFSEFQARAREVQDVSKVIDGVPDTAFQDNDGVSEMIENFLFENNLRVFFFEEQKRMLEVARRCTLTVTSEDSKVSWDMKVALSKSSAPEEKVLAYLLYVMLVNQNQRREDEMQSMTQVPSRPGRPPAAAAAGGAPSAPSTSSAAAGTWQRASWAATPWPENSNASRLEELVDKVKRCVVEGVTMDDDSDSDGFSVISEQASIPVQYRACKRLFVDGLPRCATPDEVKAVFAKCGTVNYVRILDNKRRKRGRSGCALVYFPDHATVERVLQNRPFEFSRKGDWSSRVPLKVIEDRRLQRREARALRKDGNKNKPSEKGTKCAVSSTGDKDIADDGQKIYAGNVPLNVLVPELQKIFSKFGNVLSVNMRPHGVGRKDFGFAFIIFADKASAQRALKGRPIMYGNVDLQVREYKPRGASSTFSKGKKQDADNAGTPGTPAMTQASLANASSFTQSQGLYPSLSTYTENNTKVSQFCPSNQAKVALASDASRNREQQPPPRQSSNVSRPDGAVGVSYDDIVRGTEARVKQAKKNQPPAGRKSGKGDDSCCVM